MWLFENCRFVEPGLGLTSVIIFWKQEMVQNRNQDTLMISALPLLAFQKGLLPKEDAG